jgi:hypothetical protein
VACAHVEKGVSGDHPLALFVPEWGSVQVNNTEHRENNTELWTRFFSVAHSSTISLPQEKCSSLKMAFEESFPYKTCNDV